MQAAGGQGGGGQGGQPKPLVQGLQYICGQCNALNRLTSRDIVRCKDCGYRIFYKVRPDRCAYYPTSKNGLAVPHCLPYPGGRVKRGRTGVGCRIAQCPFYSPASVLSVVGVAWGAIIPSSIFCSLVFSPHPTPPLTRSSLLSVTQFEAR